MTNNEVDQPPVEKPNPSEEAVTKKARRINAFLALLAFSLAAMGQFTLMYDSGNMITAFIFFIAGVLIFGALIWRSEAGKRPTRFSLWLDNAITRLFEKAPKKVVLTLVSIGLVYVALQILVKKSGDATYLDVLALWIAACAVYAMAYVQFPPIETIKFWFSENRREIALIAGLTLLGGILRFIWLGSIPNIISGDEGRIGNLVNAAGQGSGINLFATWYGHGTLYLFIMAELAKLAGGLNPTTLRLTSAISGTLTIPATYIFSRHFFGKRIALTAACLLLFSHIHVHFSRIIVTASIQDAFFTTLTWYFFLTGLEKKSATRMAISALILGFFLHIYMGARLTLALIPVYLIILSVVGNFRLVRENLANLLVFGIGLAISSAPITLWAYTHVAEFNARMNQLGIVQSGWLEQTALATGKSYAWIFLEQLRDSFLAIVYYPAYGFYFSNYSAIDSITAIFFILGLAYSVFHLRDKTYLLLNGWLWSTVLVGGALIISPAQTVYKMLMILPVVFILAAIGAERIIRYVSDALDSPTVQTAFLVIFVLLTSALNFKYYFVDYAFSCKYEDSNTRLASFMGESLGKLGPDYTAFLLGAPRYVYGVHPSTDFLSGNIPVTNVLEPITAPPFDLGVQPPIVFFFTPQRVSEIDYVMKAFPNGQVEQVVDCDEPVLIYYHVP